MLPLAVAVAPIAVAAMSYRRRVVGRVLTGAAILFAVVITAAWWLLFGGDTH